MTKPHDKKQLGGEERLPFIVQFLVHHLGKPRQELKAGTEATAVAECCLLARFPWLAVGFLTASRTTR